MSRKEKKKVQKKFNTNHRIKHKRNTISRTPEIQITVRQIYKLQKLQKYTQINFRNKQMQNTEIYKYQLQTCRNTNYRITEIQVKQKFTHNSKVIHD